MHWTGELAQERQARYRAEADRAHLAPDHRGRALGALAAFGRLGAGLARRRFVGRPSVTSSRTSPTGSHCDPVPVARADGGPASAPTGGRLHRPDRALGHVHCEIAVVEGHGAVRP